MIIMSLVVVTPSIVSLYVDFGPKRIGSLYWVPVVLWRVSQLAACERQCAFSWFKKLTTLIRSMRGMDKLNMMLACFGFIG
jgi:hypothetical protein